MFLFIRMALYFLFSAIAGAGVGLQFDEISGDVTFNIDLIVTLIVSIGGYLGTFWVSRVAKWRGGKT